MVSSFLRILKQRFLYYLEVYRDCKRYLRSCDWSGSPVANRGTHLLGDILRKYHVVEKSLGMPEFRPGSAADVVKSLIVDLKKWREQDGVDPLANRQVLVAYRVLSAYLRKHKALDYDTSDIFGDFELDVELVSVPGGVKPYKDEGNRDWEELVPMLRARASLRTYDQERLPTSDVLESIAQTAIKAPSVCNRQTGRLHVFTGDLVQEILKFQTGNRGFGHQVPVLFVVTVDLRFFLSRTERNQPFVDGGLFALQTVLGIQGEGMGSVCLNWCVSHESDERLREIAKIPDYEKVIMLIGCGYPHAEALSPVSARHSGADILTVHDSSGDL